FSRLLEAQIPVAVDLGLAVAPGQRVAGQQPLYAAKKRFFARRVSVRRVICERVVIQFRTDRAPLDERLDLRSEVERAVFLHYVIQRLDAEPVARDHEPPATAVPDRVGEHPAQLLNAAPAELLVEMDDRLGVGRTAVTVAAPLKRRAQFAVVVNLAVESDPDRVVFVRHRLTAAVGVDYGQSTMAEADRTVDQ